MVTGSLPTTAPSGGGLAMVGEHEPSTTPVS
jgi:hypothetical protein